MGSVLIIVGITAFVGTVLATLVGWLGQRRKMGGAILLGLATAIATSLCLVGTYLGYSLAGSTGGWVGLIAAMIVAGIIVPWRLGKFVRGHSGRFMAGMWFGLCALCVFGFLAGGWLGLLTITMPVVAIFWIGLYRISIYALPLRGRAQRPQAFRCLLTFHMGTNYPYYFVRDGKVEVRVEGNRFLQFFAGPGIVYTGCDHATYITDGIRVKGVFDPGLSFIGLFDQEPRVLDLRPQLRAFYVEALTRDGILIEVQVFLPFRVHTGGQNIELGKSFPFRHRAGYDIIAAELVEKSRIAEAGERHHWDEGLVPLVASPIVRDVIGQYSVDELCNLSDPNYPPRSAIADEIKRRAEKELLKRGIEVIGGWIGNLVPRDRDVLEGRVACWKTNWESKLVAMAGHREAQQARLLEMARAEACRDIVLRLSQVVERSGNVSQAVLALRFINCLGQMVGDSEPQLQVPGNVTRTLERFQSELEGQITTGIT